MNNGQPYRLKKNIFSTSFLEATTTIAHITTHQFFTCMLSIHIEIHILLDYAVTVLKPEFYTFHWKLCFQIDLIICRILFDGQCHVKIFEFDLLLQEIFRFSIERNYVHFRY